MWQPRTCGCKGSGGWSSPRRKHEKQRNIPLAEMVSKLDLRGVEDRTIRPLSSYRPQGCDLRKQIIGLIDHLFVVYSVPAFLYQAFSHTHDEFNETWAGYRNWFVTIAQGGSFPKLVKPFMTAKEAHLFLAAPDRNLIRANVWWAKMKAAGLPAEVIDRLVDRIFAYFQVDDSGGRLAETIRFFARYCGEGCGIEVTKFGEITDCVSWKLRNEPEFHMQGRTLGSVIRLTQEWHVEMQKAKLHRIIEWPGVQIRDWEFEAKEKLWTVVELHTNRELLYEGRAQRHCVFAYVQRCVAGGSAIFSMRAYPKVSGGEAIAQQLTGDTSTEITRVTIDVNAKREVVEARGPYNRPPTDEETRVLRRWARQMGLELRI